MLKRLSAILFLCVLLFNFYGYRLMIHYMQYQQTSLLEERLDRAQYRDGDLISIKTPLHLPYYNTTTTTDYERVQGSIEIDGVIYQYVKRRMYQDTLELLCLPNRASMHLQSAENEFFKLSLQGTPTSPDRPHTTVKITLPEYCQEIASYVLAAPTRVVNPSFAHYRATLNKGYTSPGKRPPRSMSFA